MTGQARSAPVPGASPVPFALDGPLPSGTTLLEASAGTGKTYAIATLAARFVAGGCPLDRLLVITFTRAATGELRSRVRERMVAARDGLERELSRGRGTAVDDDLVALLAAEDRATVEASYDRLTRAVSQFDAATIETTHGFCHRVLAELGVAGGGARLLEIVEDVGDLLAEVVDDLFVRRYARDGSPERTRGAALEIARHVARNPSALLAPELGDGTDLASTRRRLAEAVRRETERRKRAAGLLTYDDVLLRLRDSLADARRGAAALARLRARYEVVLIDEFQDTDPVQWEIVERAFGTGATTLVLIGDPKQAIYAFRGADVQAYLAAARTATTRATLDTNWRSDEPLVRALDALLLDTRLGDGDIVYRHVTPASRNAGSRLAGAPAGTALRVRQVARGAVKQTRLGDAETDAARRYVADDLACQVAELLGSAAVLEVTAADGTRRDEPVRPGHLAVLVRRNAEASLVKDALGSRGVPAVVVAPGSVFATTQAREWLRLLEALEQPASRGRAAAAALTCFVGWGAGELALAGDDERERLHDRLHAWAAILRARGVASLLATIEGATELPARLLARRDGERLLTDVHHVGELLHAAATREGLGSSGLVTWMRERIAEADGPATSDASADERSRRLESDTAAVQVLTIHRSKGLEFPVVYCPFLWIGSSSKDEFPVFHDPAAGGQRTLDVGGAKRPGYSAHLQLAIAESQGEDLRLLYVALTRARHQVVCWWAPAKDAGRSPLGRLLFARQADGTVGSGVRNPDDERVAERLAGLAEAAPGCVALETAAPSAARYQPRDASGVELELARLDRRLDVAWRRVSYTSLTAGAHEVGHDGGEEAGEAQVGDEALAGSRLAADDGAPSALRAIPLVLADTPGGAAFGTLVHRVLERTDFTDPDLHGALRAELDAELSWRKVEVGRRDALVTGLADALATPLGPGLRGLRLVELSRADRLDELDFELPLVGGDRPHGTLDVHALAALLARVLPPGDPVGAYALRLDDPAVEATLRGYLTGSLDLVVRTPDARFAVCDYKTNRIVAGEGPLTAHDYRPSALDAEMQRCHYPLQALFYLVALHRYLRWRLPAYDPDTHLAGAHYLFLRGMTGRPEAAVAGQPCGVWSWRAPAGVVGAVSDLFDEGTAP